MVACSIIVILLAVGGVTVGVAAVAHAYKKKTNQTTSANIV